ncbi:unnamed protein product [Mytilus coruscus]|uniref:Uncharacterized protein n=1 Tax=Mytilus coruscus TaxID=42192 RepID=A0A6J8B6Z8_MYTCO|nr:unnamed protein product [Mytilus coruscus]
MCQHYPERIVWLYKRWQSLYGEIQKTVVPRVEFFGGIAVDLESDNFFDPSIRNMIILDDLMSTSAKDSRINDLFTEGIHHRNLSVVVLNQNMYFGKDPTQRRNCHYLVLLNNPIDRQPVMTLGRQMYPTRSDLFPRKSEEATRRPYGFLLVDLTSGTTESSRLRTDVLQTGSGVDNSEAVEEMKDDDSFDTESTTSDIADSLSRLGTSVCTPSGPRGPWLSKEINSATNVRRGTGGTFEAKLGQRLLR